MVIVPLMYDLAILYVTSHSLKTPYAFCIEHRLKLRDKYNCNSSRNIKNKFHISMSHALYPRKVQYYCNQINQFL